MSCDPESSRSIAFSQLQSLSSPLYERGIDEAFGIAIPDALWVKALVKSRDHTLNPGLPWERHAADCVILSHVGIVGSFEQHRIFLPRQLENRFVSLLPIRPKDLHALYDTGHVVFDDFAILVAKSGVTVWGTPA